MKSSKILMPVMAIAMAVGLAFSTKANEQQSNGWIEQNDTAVQLSQDPCNSQTSEPCQVRFSDDLSTVYPVFMDEELTQEKEGGSQTPYIIER